MAAYTLFDIAYRVARELGYLYEGTATAGAVNNVTDTVYLLDTFEDNYFNAGPIFIIYDAGGLGDAPQGEWGRVSDFVKATGVATIAANLTAAVAAGDRYAIGNREFTLDTLIQNINAVLSEMQIPYVNTATVETEANITEYILPADILDQNIKVWIQRSTDTDNNLWMEYFDWYIGETSTGLSKLLIFRTLPPEPYEVKIEYYLPHPPLYTSSSKLAENLNINRVVAEAALKCLSWKKAQKSKVDPVLDQRIIELSNRVNMLRSRFPNKRPEVKLATYGITNNFDGV
jgi:hypothetical protein